MVLQLFHKVDFVPQAPATGWTGYNGIVCLFPSRQASRFSNRSSLSYGIFISDHMLLGYKWPEFFPVSQHPKEDSGSNL